MQKTFRRGSDGHEDGWAMIDAFIAVVILGLGFAIGSFALKAAYSALAGSSPSLFAGITQRSDLEEHAYSLEN